MTEPIIELFKCFDSWDTAIEELKQKGVKNTL
jgi:hypothetical protein